MATMIPSYPTQRYVLENEIGVGAYATVYTARDSVTGNRVAVKIVNKKMTEHTTYQAIDEVSMTTMFKHPYILQVHDHYQTERFVFIVSELCAGDLFQIISPEAPPLAVTRARQVLAQLSAVVDYIHSRKLVHLDIKPENVFLDKHGSVRLGDFGLAGFDGTVRMGAGSGTLAYLAPELIQSKRSGRPYVVSTSQDVWSFGVVVYAVLFGDLPWMSADDTDRDYAQYLEHDCVLNYGEYRGLTADFQKLLAQMLSPNPLERPPMSHVARFFRKQRPWLAHDKSSNTFPPWSQHSLHAELGTSPLSDSSMLLAGSLAFGGSATSSSGSATCSTRNESSDPCSSDLSGRSRSTSTAHQLAIPSLQTQSTQLSTSLSMSLAGSSLHPGSRISSTVSDFDCDVADVAGLIQDKQMKQVDELQAKFRRIAVEDLV